MAKAIRGYFEGLEKSQSLDDEMNVKYAAAAALFEAHRKAQELLN
jgi:hypothetical protein